MAGFLIRTVSRTADGRDIVRESRVDGTTLAIGRSAENSIALADLKVSPRHASARIEGGALVVEAEGSLGFTVDGKIRTSATIDPGRGAEIGIGAHRLTVSRGEGDVIVITVARVGEDGDDAAHDLAAAYSLKRVMLPKRTTAWVLAAAIAVLLLAWPIASFLMQRSEPVPATDKAVAALADKPLRADSAWSSGPLSRAHHALEKNCAACHREPFVSVRNETCASCHKDAHDHAAAPRLAASRPALGVGGRFLQTVAAGFGKEGPGACVDCHGEHEGAGWQPPTPQAFCADCHGDMKARLTDTKLGNADDFGRAHPQFRPAVTVTPADKPVLARVSLDDRPRENGGLKFPHKLHLDKLGGVARMAQSLSARKGYGGALACKDCHVPTADGVRFKPVEMEANCSACHSLGYGGGNQLTHGNIARMVGELRAHYQSTGPERPPQLDGTSRRRPGNYAQGQVYSIWFGAVRNRAAAGEAAVRAVFSPGGACHDCHGITAPGAAGNADWRVTPVHLPVRFMAKGWFDHKPHAKEKCATCHQAEGSNSAADLLLPGIKTCRDCHTGAETRAMGSGAWAGKPKLQTSCGSCHSYHAGPGAGPEKAGPEKSLGAPWVSKIAGKPGARLKGAPPAQGGGGD